MHHLNADAIAALRDILKRLLSSLLALQRIALITFQWILVVAVFVIISRAVGEIGRASLAGELASMTATKSSRSWLAWKSIWPLPLKASIFVPRKNGAVITRID